MRTIFEIEEFHHSEEDGDDFYPAMWRAQQAKHLPVDSVDDIGRIGWTILFGPKTYRFSRPIELVRCMHLQGSGGSDAPGTRFEFLNHTPGLVIHHGGEISMSHNHPDYLDESEWLATPGQTIPPRLLPPADDQTIPSGQGSIIERIAFVGSLRESFGTGEPYRNGQSFLSGKTSYALFFDRDPTRANNEEIAQHGVLVDPFETTLKPDRRPHGIVAYGRFVLKHCVVRGFAGHGIYIYGNTGGSNAGGWQIDTVTTQDNGNNGLHIVGSDAAIGHAKNLYALANRFWGIVDLSQVGNQFNGGQVSYNYYGGFLRPRTVRFSQDPDPAIANGEGFPLAGTTLLRWVYGESNAAFPPAPPKKVAPNYAGRFLTLNRFIWGMNVLEYCALHNGLVDVVDGDMIDSTLIVATGIDTNYQDSGCNSMSLEGEFIPSFNNGIRLHDRLSLVAFGSTEKKVWIRATAKGDTKPEAPSFNDVSGAVHQLPQIIFYTDPVAGGYIGSVYCIVETKPDGTQVWGYKEFGKIEA